MRRPLAVALIGLVLPFGAVSGQEAGAPSAKVAGEWDFSFTGPQGAMTWRMKLQQAGDTVTGQAMSEFGTLPLRDGWTSGDTLWFGITINYEGQVFTVYFTGLVKGDTTDGSLEVPNSGMQAIPFRAIRVKAESGSAPAFDRPRPSP